MPRLGPMRVSANVYGPRTDTAPSAARKRETDFPDNPNFLIIVANPFGAPSAGDMCVRHVFLVYYPSWRPFPLLLRTAYYSGTNERTPFRSHVLPHMTLVASCGVFVIFRGAERFVFRARTDPKDAMPRRRCGEGRANITSSESELNGRLRPSNRGRRHGVAAAEPPVRTRIFVFQPGGLGWMG